MGEKAQSSAVDLQEEEESCKHHRILSAPALQVLKYPGGTQVLATVLGLMSPPLLCLLVFPLAPGNLGLLDFLYNWDT